MIILSIETSCDETAISVIEGTGDAARPSFSILADNVASQAALHAEYGGVFPMMAKREHAKNIAPLIQKTIADAGFSGKRTDTVPGSALAEIRELLAREPELSAIFEELIVPLARPAIDRIAVTAGPGLEPALWVGINAAKALSILWDIPVIPVNHMEGHVVSALVAAGAEGTDRGAQTLNEVSFPALALLISGGHTELALARGWGDYSLIGQTLDDAAGEAFDKVARMLDLPYPGGPEISKLAERAAGDHGFSFPRPMIGTDDYNFSFSGLKTAVLYHVKKHERPTENDKASIAKEFQDAVTDVLVKKTFKAVAEHGVQTLLVGGGVAANKHIRDEMQKKRDRGFPDLKLFFPRRDLATDNALMIGIAGYFHALSGKETTDLGDIRADGNLSL